MVAHASVQDMAIHRRMTSVLVVACTAALVPAQARERTREPREQTVQRIVRADYAGDRASLARLAVEMAPADGEPDGALVRYWRGFAWWRRAINGFNETPMPTDLGNDLARAREEFERALAFQPDFVDGLAGVLSCIQLKAFLARDNPDAVRALLPAFRETLEHAQRVDPSHPRLLWVAGQASWYTPPGTPASVLAERQAAAIGMYERGLRSLATGRPAPHALAPRWGEPELLMNLAWSHLNAATPNPAAARAYAERALSLVPDWHYVKDLLMPQIVRALPQK